MAITSFDSDSLPLPAVSGGRNRRKVDVSRRCCCGKLDAKCVSLLVLLFFTCATVIPLLNSRHSTEQLEQQDRLPPFNTQKTSEVAVLQDELQEARQALKDLKKYAMQQPWQDFGRCTADLADAKELIVTLEGRLEDAGISLSTNSTDTAPSSGCKVCLECPRAHANPECAPTLPCPSIDTPALVPDVVTPGGTKTEDEALRAAILRSMNVTEEAKRLQVELDEARQSIERLTTQLHNILGAEPVAPGSSSGCTAPEEDIAKYLDYTPYGDCPDDWLLVQSLVFEHGCMQLPRRRCLTRTPSGAVEPRPRKTALWDQRALDDRNVRWTHHTCNSFQCLNTRAKGECARCFNFSLEANRWETRYRGSLTVEEVVRMKKGGLRIGLDMGGGTGSFAAKMAAYNVTIVTSGMNLDGASGKGLPYMETVALRGLVGLHLPFRSRLPFFDNTLDIVHAMNAIKYPTLFAFEEIIYEWDRVLRPGGIVWLELFYAPTQDMPAYIGALDRLGYTRQYWNSSPKPEASERRGEHVYLNCVLEKPTRLS